jgi:hypothetical protein
MRVINEQVSYINASASKGTCQSYLGDVIKQSIPANAVMHNNNTAHLTNVSPQEVLKTNACYRKKSLSRHVLLNSSLVSGSDFSDRCRHSSCGAQGINNVCLINRLMGQMLQQYCISFLCGGTPRRA